MANSQGSFVKRNSDKGSLGRKPCYIYKSPEHMIGSSKRKASRDSSEERKRMIGSSKRKASRDSSEEHKRMIGSIKRKASEGSSEERNACDNYKSQWRMYIIDTWKQRKMKTSSTHS